MIKTLIFDFGDVFINLDKPATAKAFAELGDFTMTPELQNLYDQYEIGKVTSTDFVDQIQKLLPNATREQIKEGWNAILKDFPERRLDFLKQIADEGKYKLILFSNTNEIHIDYIKENVPFFESFKNCFHTFYLSHEVHLRKPNTEVFSFMLKEHQLKAEETLFIDDTKVNTDSAAALGIHVWNNDPFTEDVTELFLKKSDLF